MPNLTNWSTVYRCLDALLRRQETGSIADLLVQSEDATYIAWNLAALCPWMVVDHPPDPKRKLNYPPPVALMAREGFKAPNKLSDVIAASHRHRREILDLKQAVCEKRPIINERDRFGMAIRRWDAQGGSWRLQVLNALLVEAMEAISGWPEATIHAEQGLESQGLPEHKANEERATFLSGWQAFLDHLTELDVFEAPSLKRLLDGRQLAQALGTKPGKWTGQALEICVAWQLRNPKEEDPSGAVEEVRRRKEELGIALI